MNGRSCTVRKLLSVGLILAIVPLVFSGGARAEDASVLPKGRTRVTLDNLFYFPVENRYNPHGNAEPIAGDFDNRRLDSTVFSLLSPLANPLLVPGGIASIGDSQVKYEYNYHVLDLGGQYGLTDRLTIGIDIPYFWATNDVKADLSSGPGSSATLGLRTGPPVAAPICSGSVIPLGSVPALGGLSCSAVGTSVRRFTTEDVQNLLGRGLQTPSGAFISGFGFKRIENWQGDGLGDITVGAKYQYLRTQDWALASTGGVRFPTGRQDDPDDLSDVYWSTGEYALLFRLHNDYTISNLWNRRPPSAETGRGDIAQPGDLVLDGTFKYDWTLPDRATVRVPDSVTSPITNNREQVYRDLGDRFELEFGARYSLPRGFSLSALYRYAFKTSDEILGHRGFNYHLLQKHTDSTEQIFIVSAGYSTLPLYLEKRFPIPLGVSLSYRDRFAGSGPHSASSPSQILDTRYLGLGLQILF